MRSSSSSRALAALAIFFLASVSTAEASRIGFDFGDRGLIIWDGQNDVGSMNAPIKATVAGDLGITTASQLVVDLSVINTGPLGDGIVDGPRAYLMVSGPDAAGQKNAVRSALPGSGSQRRSALPGADQGDGEHDHRRRLRNDPATDRVHRPARFQWDLGVQAEPERLCRVQRHPAAGDEPLPSIRAARLRE